MLDFTYIGDFLFLLITVAVWTVAIKGVALWTAAKRREKGWFVAILVINTVGILEVIYLLITRQNKAAPKKHPKTAFETLVEKEATLSSRQQAILRILKGVMDHKQQTAVSDAALRQAVASIEDRLAGKVTRAELQSMLDKPADKGGAGLYKQTAEHIAEHVEAVIVATNNRA